MDSSLSSVPPVCPSPRPESCGTAAPHAATSGVSGSVILSPTPPVECLSDGRSVHSGQIEPLTRADHRGGPPGDLAIVHAAQQNRHGQRRHLLVGHHALGVPVDHPVDLLIGKRRTVALGPDNVDRRYRHRAAPFPRALPSATFALPRSRLLLNHPTPPTTRRPTLAAPDVFARRLARQAAAAAVFCAAAVEGRPPCLRPRGASVSGSSASRSRRFSFLPARAFGCSGSA